MPSLKHNGQTIQYSVRRSSRIKTSELIVDADTVAIRAPMNKPVGEIRRIVKDKADWIIKKQDHYRQAQADFSMPNFEDGSELLYLGRLYPLNVVTGYNNDKVRLVNGKFLITLSSAKYSKENVKALYKGWLYERAEKILNEKVNRFAGIVGVEPEKVVIKNLKRRWGSAAKGEVLTFNLNLMKSPEEIVDYVVIHELCHLRVRNHSHRFWNVVRRFMPDYERRRDWLAKYSMTVIG